MAAISPRQIAGLSVVERPDLIGEIWDSLSDADVAVPPAQLAEIDRRLGSLDEDAKSAITWDEFKTKLAA
ncbi:MAG: addiction module protein [Asticcacaulis sp.]